MYFYTKYGILLHFKLNSFCRKIPISHRKNYFIEKSFLTPKFALIHWFPPRMGAGGVLLGCLPPKAKKLTLQVYRPRNQNQNL